MKISEPITIRTKTLKDGRESIYLDIYYNKKREYEFLKLYLYPNPSRDRLIAERNKATKKAAETIKTRRMIELQSNAHGIGSPSKDMTVTAAFEEYIRDKEKTIKSGSVEIYEHALKHWRIFDKYGIKLADLTANYLLDYVKYLKTAKNQGNCNHERILTPLIAKQYFAALGQMLNRCKRKGYIQQSPMELIESADKPKGSPAEREYLTFDELERISKAECVSPQCKAAFMLACFSGLRISDIKALTWDNIKDGKIMIRQKKTSEMVYVPLSENAISWLPERTDGYVFHLPESCTLNKNIRNLAANAGIKKKVTFHVSRHTFATLALTYGADLYTVSRLLGHRNIATTQIYAKVIDKKKEEAVSLIPTMKKGKD